MARVHPDLQLKMCTELIVAKLKKSQVTDNETVNMIADISSALRQYYGWDNDRSSEKAQLEACQCIVAAYLEHQNSDISISAFIIAIASKMREYYGWA